MTETSNEFKVGQEVALGQRGLIYRLGRVVAVSDKTVSIEVDGEVTETTKEFPGIRIRRTHHGVFTDPETIEAFKAEFANKQAMEKAAEERRSRLKATPQNDVARKLTNYGAYDSYDLTESLLKLSPDDLATLREILSKL